MAKVVTVIHKTSSKHSLFGQGCRIRKVIKAFYVNFFVVSVPYPNNDCKIFLKVSVSH